MTHVRVGTVPATTLRVWVGRAGVGCLAEGLIPAGMAAENAGPEGVGS